MNKPSIWKITKEQAHHDHNFFVNFKKNLLKYNIENNNKRILDIGCGLRNPSYIFLSPLSKEIIGIDNEYYSAPFIPRFRNYLKILGLKRCLKRIFREWFLDRIYFNEIEKITGKPLSEKNRQFLEQVGIALLIALMVYATFKDIIRLRSPWK